MLTVGRRARMGPVGLDSKLLACFRRSLLLWINFNLGSLKSLGLDAYAPKKLKSRSMIILSRISASVFRNISQMMIKYHIKPVSASESGEAPGFGSISLSFTILVLHLLMRHCRIQFVLHGIDTYTKRLVGTAHTFE